MFVYADLENLDLGWIKMKFWYQISEQANNIMSYPLPTTYIGPCAILWWVLFCDDISNNACAWLQRKGPIWPLWGPYLYCRHPCIPVVEYINVVNKVYTYRVNCSVSIKIVLHVLKWQGLELNLKIVFYITEWALFLEMKLKFHVYMAHNVPYIRIRTTS